MNQANAHSSQNLHWGHFKFGAKVIGGGVYSREEYELISAEDTQYLQEMHEGTSEAFARSMNGLAGGLAVLAASLCGGMESWVEAYLMRKAMGLPRYRS